MRILTSLFLMTILVLLSCGCGASGPSVINLAGNWIISLYPAGQLGITAPMIITQAGKYIDGTIVTSAGSLPITGTVDGSNLTGRIASTDFMATVNGDSWNGSFRNTQNGFHGTLYAARTSAQAMSASAEIGKF